MAIKKYYEQNKNKLFWEGGFSFANFTLLNGVFLVGFALSLEASNLMIGILSSIPLFANLLQMFSAFILEASGSRKRTAIISQLFARIMWVPIIMIALGILSYSPLVLFTIILVVSSLLNAIGSLSILSWMKDIVPLRKLSSFWGKRNIYASVAGIISYIIGSVIIDYFPGNKTYGYIFSAAVVFGLLGVIVISRLPEKKRKIKAISWSKFKKNISVPFNDKEFRPLLYFGIYWGFALNVVAPFYIVFMLQDLGMTFTVISVLLTIDLIARVAGMTFWGKFSDKWGSRPGLIICVTVNILAPLLFVFIPSNTTLLNYVLITVVWVFASIANAGIEISTTRALFKSAPRKHDAYYLSVFSSLTGLMSAIGPIIGGLIATLFTILDFLPDFFSPIRSLFLIAFILRTLAIPLSSRIQEPQARAVDDVLLRIKDIKFFSFFAGMYNVGHYASQAVLFPGKQLFFIQRKAVERMGTDVRTALGLMKKLSDVLEKVTSKNIGHYKKRIHELKLKLGRSVNKLDYQEGTWYEELPAKALEKVENLEIVIDDVGIGKKSDTVHDQVSRLRKKLKGAFDRNIK